MIRAGGGGVLLISGLPMPASTSYDTAEDAKGKRESEKKKNNAGRVRRLGKIRSNGEALFKFKKSMTYLWNNYRSVENEILLDINKLLV